MVGTPHGRVDMSIFLPESPGSFRLQRIAHRLWRMQYRGLPRRLSLL
jgi:hypothetical protein